MKRYALFAGANYYPAGGWDDFVDSFETLDEATNQGKRLLERNGNRRGDDWFHVVDLQTGEWRES